MHIASLAGMERAAIPIWVMDLDRRRICWANDRALEMWRAVDRDDLFARDFSGIPQSVRTRFELCLDVIRQGRAVEDDWTFYPRGVPVTVRLHLSAVTLDDGRLGMLNQAIPRETGPDPALLRGIEALRHTPVMVTLVDPRGEILMQNQAAQRAFGVDTPWSARFCDPELGPNLLRAAETNEETRWEARVRTADGERWHMVEAQPVRDPVTGGMATLIHHTDETLRLGAEREARERGELVEELQRALRLVDEQRRQILSLSTPLLDVGERTLALPIIGALDAERSAEIADHLLPAIAARGAARVLIDLTGAGALDAGSAAALIRLTRAVRLLGARPILTGIGPEVARELIAAGADFTGVVIRRSLAQGLAARTEAGG